MDQNHDRHYRIGNTMIYYLYGYQHREVFDLFITPILLIHHLATIYHVAMASFRNCAYISENLWGCLKCSIHKQMYNIKRGVCMYIHQ